MSVGARGFSILALASGILALAAASGSAQDVSGGGSATGLAATEGKQVYEEICQACHMADAKGGGEAGAQIPALANNPKLRDPDYIVTLLLKGRAGMPWFTEMLTPAQMASVATYVRSHFNAYPEPVTEADVKRVAASGPLPGKPECNSCGK